MKWLITTLLDIRMVAQHLGSMVTSCKELFIIFLISVLTHHPSNTRMYCSCVAWTVQAQLCCQSFVNVSEMRDVLALCLLSSCSLEMIKMSYYDLCYI